MQDLTLTLDPYASFKFQMGNASFQAADAT